MSRRSGFSRFASALVKGAVAGAAGTALMTASSTIEAKVRGRKPSDAPAKAAGKVLGVTPVGEEQKRRFSQFVHWAYGTAWGVPRGLYGLAGMPPVAASAVHLGSVWGAELVMLPKLGVAPPVRRWRADEIAIDVFHHLVYAIGAGLAYAALDRITRD